MSDLDGARAELEEYLLGGQRSYTRGEVAELTGFAPEQTRRLWLAMGFAEAGDDERIFTDGDVHALRTLRELIDTGAIDDQSTYSIARTLGQTMSRLAEWQTRELRARIADITDDTTSGMRISLAVVPLIEQLMSYVWRRQVAAAAGRGLGAPDEAAQRQVMVVGFADIVGYTATTRHLSVDDLAAMLDAFESDAADIVAAHHGQVVKQVGDEVMFTVERPADAAEIGLALCAESRAERGLPQLRVGMAMGPVLPRYGDVYGSVVNLAARLTSVARPGTALVDAELAAPLADERGVHVRALRPISVRGYRHLRPSVLRRDSDSHGA